MLSNAALKLVSDATKRSSTTNKMSQQQNIPPTGPAGMHATQADADAARARQQYQTGDVSGAIGSEVKAMGHKVAQPFSSGTGGTATGPTAPGGTLNPQTTSGGLGSSTGTTGLTGSSGTTGSSGITGSTTQTTYTEQRRV
jgi:hypothetical protein